MTYKIFVRCPKCGKIQGTLLAKTHRCVYCGHSFSIFPKRKQSRVVKVEGNYNEYLKDVERLLRRIR